MPTRNRSSIWMSCRAERGEVRGEPAEVAALELDTEAATRGPRCTPSRCCRQQRLPLPQQRSSWMRDARHRRDRAAVTLPDSDGVAPVVGNIQLALRHGPALIDRIVTAVIERMSDDVVREIAWMSFPSWLGCTSRRS